MGCGRSRPNVVDPEPPVATAAAFIQHRNTAFHQSYDMLESLGRGGFAEVRKAIFKPTQDFRAVKVIYKIGVTAEGVDQKHRLREMKVLRGLDHPNILRVHELLEDQYRYYLVMEFCQGGDLFSRLLSVKHFSEAQVGQIMHQLLSAVTYCHQRYVIHRDLKPENLLLETQGSDLTLKVADFGSSAYIDPNMKLNGVQGSAYYVAPEVLRESYNEKCDLWSCGIIMYILMTGKAPYAGKTEREILSNVLSGALNLSELPTLSSDARDLISQCLTANPRIRITASDALQHPFLLRCKSPDSTTPLSLQHTLLHLSEFHCASKLKDAIYTFIATQIISQSNLKELREAFQSIDKNGDGRISRQELVDKYRETAMNSSTNQTLVEEIMKQVDTDNSGFIDYSEFLHASLDKAKHLSKNNLKAAFEIFDKDGNGRISCEELKGMLAGAGNENEAVWREIIREVDENGDGEIDLKEFEQLVMSKV